MLDEIKEQLCIVLPCFNEETGLNERINLLTNKLSSLIEKKLITHDSFLLFVDDGSTDNTWDIIKKAHSQLSAVKGIRLAANRGKEQALYAGLMEAKEYADIVISMDADLQHDINAIELFLEQRTKGYDFVYGIKSERGKEPIIRKIGANLFYWLMRKLGSPVKPNHTDYCLMSRQVLHALAEYKESHMIIRGLLYQLGFRQKSVSFAVRERIHGKSKMSFRKLISLSIDAITSFSITPLRIITCIGIIMCISSLIMISWTVHDFFIHGTPNGWATLVCSIWFTGGIITLSLATIGEYIGKTYLETKQRPRYFIYERLK